MPFHRTPQRRHDMPAEGLSAVTPTPHWVGRVGHGRHGGGASALCGGPLMSALTLWSFPVKRKGQEKGTPEVA